MAAFIGCAAADSDVIPRSVGAGSTPSLDDAFEWVAMGGGAAVKPLVENPTSWAERWAMLDEAEDRIDVTYFILQDDVFGYAFLGRLLEKARDGVKVRLMIDTRGLAVQSYRFWLGPVLNDLIDEPNFEVRRTGPVFPRIVEAVADLDISPLVASNHDKLLLVDGRAGMLGGRNIGREYLVGVEDTPLVFSDVDLAVESPEVVRGLTAAFDAEWSRASRVLPSPVPPSADRLDVFPMVAAAMDLWLAQPPLEPEDAALLREDSLPRRRTARDLIQALTLGEEPELAFGARGILERTVHELVGYPTIRGARPTPGPWHRVDARILDSRTRTMPEELDFANEQLAELIRSAEDEIVILNPYIMLTPVGFEVLKEVGRRGVNITLLTNSPDSTDSLLTQALFLRLWPEILAAVPNGRIFVQRHRPAHGKVAVIDQQVTLLGSYNVDYVSAYTNGEIGLVMRSRSFAAEMRGRILDRISHSGEEVLEWRIARDDRGQAIRDEAGQVVVEFGPEDHCSPEILQQIQLLRTVVEAASGFIPLPKF